MNNRSESARPEYAGFYPVIAPLVMCSGVGDGKTTACVMAQAATIDALRKGKTLDAPTDQMECACPILRRMAIRANDASWWASDAERTQHLRPLIPLLLDSRQSDATSWRRVWFLVDNAVRVLTPVRLEFIGRKEDKKNIARLRGMSPIVDREGCNAARNILSEMKLSASAHVSADAYAYADVSAYADADAYVSAYAYAYTSAHVSADAYADVQRIKYRAAYLQLFRDVAAIKD